MERILSNTSEGHKGATKLIADIYGGPAVGKVLSLLSRGCPAYSRDHIELLPRGDAGKQAFHRKQHENKLTL